MNTEFAEETEGITEIVGKPSGSKDRVPVLVSVLAVVRVFQILI